MMWINYLDISGRIGKYCWGELMLGWLIDDVLIILSWLFVNIIFYGLIFYFFYKLVFRFYWLKEEGKMIIMGVWVLMIGGKFSD